MLEEVVVLARVQMNTDGAELCGPICSTSGALAVQWVVGHCHGEELAHPADWPLAEGTAVFGASHNLLSTLL